MPQEVMLPQGAGEGRPAIEQDARWAAVVARDRTADGRFFYSVATTGIYCRPSCAARRANPVNVRFHATAAEAEACGFRACLRCRPDRLSLRQEQAAVVAQACRRISTAEEAPRLDTLAAAAGLSPWHFHRIFKAITGLTPRSYWAAELGRRLRADLPGSRNVAEAIYGAGYGSGSRLYEKSAAVLGMTPTLYRSGGAEVQIRFALGECSLGSVLVASSERGVCAILLGDDPDALLRDLQDRFPKATMIGADGQYEALVAKVVGLVEAPGHGHDLPLDVAGTAFQQRVWQALCAIPPGSTASYGEIARTLGAPGAARAVAQACAANPVAVAIPCHRVVRTDGDLSGYRWGVARKSVLLAREAQTPTPARSGKPRP